MYSKNTCHLITQKIRSSTIYVMLKYSTLKGTFLNRLANGDANTFRFGGGLT